MKPATLIIASSESDANLYYASRFVVPDPVVYFEIGGKKHLVLSDLEIDRGRLQAKVHVFHSLSDVAKRVPQSLKGKGYPSYALIVHALFRPKKIKQIIVPSNFPSQYYVALTKLGYRLTIKPEPFFEQRLIKTDVEKKNIRHALAQVEKALGETLKFLQNTKIKGNRIYNGKEVVTSELLQDKINSRLMELGCVANHTIIASGIQGSLPHHEGAGPIIPHTPIIFDIFPRHAASRYHADMTRTVVKGKPSDMVKKMYQAVLEANLKAQSVVRAGVTGKFVHETAVKQIEKKGFKTGPMDGSMQGFIHSTGHGLGLDVHELPTVSTQGGKLKAGNVVTIEPGLYYRKYGGIRLEDVVYVTKTGSIPLTKFPRKLELDQL